MPQLEGSMPQLKGSMPQLEGSMPQLLGERGIEMASEAGSAAVQETSKQACCCATGS